MAKRKRKIKDEQPYKVSKEFIKWMDIQICVMENWQSINRWEDLENEIHLESYRYIRGLIK